MDKTQWMSQDEFTQIEQVGQVQVPLIDFVHHSNAFVGSAIEPPEWADPVVLDLSCCSNVKNQCSFLAKLVRQQANLTLKMN